MTNAEKINAWFDNFEHKIDYLVPGIVADTAVTYYKESFITKSFDGKPWQPVKSGYKPKIGSLMARHSLLLNSIRAYAFPGRVLITAGNSKVPYAQIHNEGGIIARNARSEIFVRNRYKIGAKGKAFGGQGLYKKGIKTGDGKKTLQGLTFKAYTIKIPQRQFMGHSAILNKRIIKRLKESF